MTTLLISPDYASHYYGLATLGRAHGGRVVVATGPALRECVLADGFEHVELRLGAGHNDGVAGAGGQSGAEREHLRAFFAATRRGMAATVAFQVRSRGRDMLWQPERVTRELAAVLERVQPEHVVVDQLAFGATLALRALERPFVSFLPSHPCQLPLPGDVDGFPVRFPEELAPGAGELEALRALCERRTRAFTETYNATLARLNPAAAPVTEAVSTGGSLLTVIAYPEELAPEAARPGVALVGPVVRAELPDAGLRRGLARRRPGLPTVYVSLGTFLSARDDVLATIAEALRAMAVNVVLSTGVADIGRLGPLPEHWHVAPSVAQVAALATCDAVICHGGNNTVMEALSAGLPVLAGPFSSDQFVAAEDLRRHGVGDAFDPNRADAAEIGLRVTRLLSRGARDRACELGRRLRARPGAQRAWEQIEETVVA
jgi:zeaxanthin glucosyltransferase